MLKLLVTQRAICTASGQKMHHSMTEHVELLLDNYVRQLTRTMHAVKNLETRVRSKQDLAMISLDVYRNRMLRVDVQLTLVSVAVAMSTGAASLFGMNIAHGLEKMEGAFPIVTGLTIFAGAVVYYTSWHWYSHYILTKQQKDALFEQQALQNMFTDMEIFDLAVRKAQRRTATEASFVDFKKFKELVSESVDASKNMPSNQEVGIMFDMLDITRDGVLNRHEVFALQAAARRMASRAKAQQRSGARPEDTASAAPLSTKTGERVSPPIQPGS
mmetsp:Transcript_48036/g.75007  ORF Transcript_48036/g.75007 Transcript_48036/m.75007 type:complete len:273 (-) Transcript_48036:1144-1962(-)